jgi:hypothetical protein
MALMHGSHGRVPPDRVIPGHVANLHVKAPGGQLAASTPGRSRSTPYV